MGSVQNNLNLATITVGEFPVEITGISIDLTNRTFSVSGTCYASCGMPTDSCQQSGNWSVSGNLVTSDTEGGGYTYSLPSPVSEYLNISGTVSPGGGGTWTCVSNGASNPATSETTAFSYVYVHRFWEGDSSGPWYTDECDCRSTGSGTTVECMSEWGACSQYTSFGFYSPSCDPTADGLNITHTVDASCVTNILLKDGYSCDENGGRSATCTTRSTAISNTLTGLSGTPPAIIYAQNFAPSMTNFGTCDSSGNCTTVASCDAAMAYLAGCPEVSTVQRATITSTLNYTRTYNLTLSQEE